MRIPINPNCFSFFHFFVFSLYPKVVDNITSLNYLCTELDDFSPDNEERMNRSPQ
jgi:hypothetical protein